MTQIQCDTGVCRISRNVELRTADDLRTCLHTLGKSIETCGFLLAGHAPSSTVATLIRAAADIDRVAQQLGADQPVPDEASLV
ncbi:MAG: hypothetical protein AAGA05_05965 [Pseudomonadota bacterium]